MDATVWVSLILGVPSTAFGGVALYRQIRSTTAADNVRAAEAIRQQVQDARREERETCRTSLDAKDERIADLQGDVSVERERANAERARADALQTLINEQRLRGNG